MSRRLLILITIALFAMAGSVFAGGPTTSPWGASDNAGAAIVVPLPAGGMPVGLSTIDA